jgi:hypothetical protein
MAEGRGAPRLSRGATCHGYHRAGQSVARTAAWRAARAGFSSAPRRHGGWP